MVLGITVIPYAVVKAFAPMGITPETWFGDIAAVREEHPDKPLAVCAVGNAGFVADICRSEPRAAGRYLAMPSGGAGQSSGRKGEAGRPAPRTRSHAGSAAHA